MTRLNLTPNQEKLQELIIYIANRCEFDPKFGLVKLNKILFFSDFIAYAELDNPITGTTYRKFEFGPIPANIAEIRKRLQGQGDTMEKESSHYGRPQKRIVARREANLDLFSAKEIAIADRVIEELKDENATTVSTLSHQFEGWKLADYGEDIPYETIFLATEKIPLAREEFEYGEQLANQLGL